MQTEAGTGAGLSEILVDGIRVELSLLGWLTGESQVTQVCAHVCTRAGWHVIRVQHAGWSPRVKVACGRRNCTDTLWMPHPRPPTNPSVTSGSSQAAQAGRTLNSVSSQGGGAVPSSDHLQERAPIGGGRGLGAGDA